MFGVTESTVKRWSNSGKLSCFKTPGGHRRYTANAILQFIYNFKYLVDSTLPGPTLRKGNTAKKLIDFLLLKKNYRTLCDVYLTDTLRGDTESMVRLLVDCSSKTGMPLLTIYEEIVSKTINKINKLSRDGKLNHDQQDSAINAILESLLGSRPTS